MTNDQIMWSLVMPLVFHNPFPSPAWGQHLPTNVLALLQVDRIGRTGIRLHADGLAVRRCEQHQLAERRRRPHPKYADSWILDPATLDQPVRSWRHGGEVRVPDIEGQPTHRPRVLQVEVAFE